MGGGGGAGGGTEAPGAAATPAAAGAIDPLLGDSATLEYPGVLEGVYPIVDQFGNPVSPPAGSGLGGGGVIDPIGYDGGLLGPPTYSGGTITQIKPAPTTSGFTSTSTVYPIPGVKPPSGSTGVARANGLKYLYSVRLGTATRLAYSGLTFSAYIGPSAHYLPNATLRKILSGAHAGLYVHPADPGLTITNL
jgi:hypothetical protein